MTINRKELFTLAWTIARQDQWSRRLPSLQGLFGDALRKAWREMKRRAEIAAQRIEPARCAADLLAAIRDLENRDRLRIADLERLAVLRAKYAATIQREAGDTPSVKPQPSRRPIRLSRTYSTPATYHTRAPA